MVNYTTNYFAKLEEQSRGFDPSDTHSKTLSEQLRLFGELRKNLHETIEPYNIEDVEDYISRILPQRSSIAHFVTSLICSPIYILTQIDDDTETILAVGDRNHPDIMSFHLFLSRKDAEMFAKKNYPQTETIFARRIPAAYLFEETHGVLYQVNARQVSSGKRELDIVIHQLADLLGEPMPIAFPFSMFVQMVNATFGLFVSEK